MNREKQIVQLTEKMLENKGICPTDIKDEFQYKQAIARINGKQFTLSDYAYALIFSQLSAQRPWYQIDRLSEKIEIIFHNFEYNKVKNLAKNPEKLIKKHREIKAGNRSIKRQMKELSHNLNILEKLFEYIEDDYPQKVSFNQILHYNEKYNEMISHPKSRYKLRFVGQALAAEFLKNIGIPSVKPDIHILRILGIKRLAILSAEKTKLSRKETQRVIKEFHLFIQRHTGNVADITYYDALFWNFGAKKQAEICTENPKCNICLLIDFCNYTFTG